MLTEKDLPGHNKTEVSRHVEFLFRKGHKKSGEKLAALQKEIATQRTTISRNEEMIASHETTIAKQQETSMGSFLFCSPEIVCF